MTSTSFNVGLIEKKNSSRVLKPPGGGHTDIFGINPDTEIVNTPSKKKYAPPTTITSCFGDEEVDHKPKEQPNNNLEKEANGEQNGNGIIVDENTEPSLENNEEKKNEQEAPKKTRVPPGGFSSILW